MLEFPKADFAINLKEMETFVFLRYFFDRLAGIFFQNRLNLSEQKIWKSLSE